MGHVASVPLTLGSIGMPAPSVVTSASEAKRRIFISYSRNDMAFADRLEAAQATLKEFDYAIANLGDD
jgi:hypothetical protein